jgi:hypothetical protein
MTDTSTNRPTGRRSSNAAAADDRDGTSRSVASGVVPAIVMTPAAALARHIEWLEFALGAATAEERWRRDRLAKADKGNRAKRTDRLADVLAEIDELTALLAGIRELQAAAPSIAPVRRRGRPPGSKTGTGRRSRTAAAGGTATRTSATATPVTASTTAAKPATARSTAAKPAAAKSATAKPAATRRRSAASSTPPTAG